MRSHGRTMPQAEVEPGRLQRVGIVGAGMVGLGQPATRSWAHAAFVAVETLKVLALATAGTLLLAG